MASQDLRNLIKKTKAVSLRNKVTLQVLQTVHVMTDERIFKGGSDANGGQIGVYSKAYLKVRQRMNYDSSRKVILQATSQMVNDYKLLVLPNGNYGSGFSNNANFKKSFWVEDTYKKPIFKLQKAEEKQMEILFEKKLDKYFAGL